MVTPLQHKICEFIKQYIDQQGYSPSLTEIASGIGLSPNSISLISRNIHSLTKLGKLKYHRKGYRNIELGDSSKVGRQLELPLVGRIAAGTPIEAIEDKQLIDLSALFMPDNHFLLEVKGDSMVDEGIFDGDLVICRQASKVYEGEIVVALIDEQEATLKRVSYKIADRITLVPANPTLKPKAYLPHRVQIQGVFVGLLRLTNKTRK